MMTLMANGQFPIHNLCYQLFMDVIQWYSARSTTEMRYSDEIGKFWYIGKRLFQGKFVAFMRGPAGKCQLASGIVQPGRTDHHDCPINFVVPRDLSHLPQSKIPDKFMLVSPTLITTKCGLFICNIHVSCVHILLQLSLHVLYYFYINVTRWCQCKYSLSSVFSPKIRLTM